MPYVVPVPIGNNVAQVAGLSERTRSAEAKRSALGINTTGGPVTTDGLGTTKFWTFPGQNPTTVNVGADGFLFAQGGVGYAPLTAFSPIFAVAIDGVYTADSGSSLAVGALGSYLVGSVAFTGLTPGWHEVTTGVYYSDGGTPFTFGSVVVWFAAWAI